MINPTADSQKYWKLRDKCQDTCDRVFPDKRTGWGECLDECRRKLPASNPRYAKQGAAIDAATAARGRNRRNRRRHAGILRNRPSAYHAAYIGRH